MIKILDLDPETNPLHTDELIGARGGRLLREEERSKWEEYQKLPFLDGISFLQGFGSNPLVDNRVIEYTTAPITASGWHTLFITDLVANRGKEFDFIIISSGSGSRREVIKGSCSLVSETSTRTHGNTDIKIYRLADASGKFMRNVRVITSAVATSGAKLQVYFDVSATVLITYKVKNNLTQMATADSFGWKAVPPVLENNPDLPDGITLWASAIVLSAGEEKILVNSALTFPAEGYYTRASDDIIRCTVPWEDVPFWATALTLNIVTTFTFTDSSGGSSAVGAYAIGNLDIMKKGIQFSLSQTGIALGFDSGPLALKVAGVDTKYILS
jgi:hypothetical protein